MNKSLSSEVRTELSKHFRGEMRIEIKTDKRLLMAVHDNSLHSCLKAKSLE